MYVDIYYYTSDMLRPYVLHAILWHAHRLIARIIAPSRRARATILRLLAASVFLTFHT